MEYKQWYMEYKIHKNRPGLLGDIASMLGMLEVNILTINGVEGKTRGMLLETSDDEKIMLMGEMLKKVDNITVTALRTRGLWTDWPSGMDGISTGIRMTARPSASPAMSSGCWSISWASCLRGKAIRL